MNVFVSIGDIQDCIADFLHTRREKPSFHRVIDALVSKGRYLTRPEYDFCLSSFLGMDDDLFLKEIRTLRYELYLDTLHDPEAYELVPPDSDLAIISQFFGLKEFLHRHDCFELCFVYRGACTFRFQEEISVLSPGDFYILSPGALHDNVLDSEDSCVFPILIRAETFATAFFSLMAGADVLSHFFRTILSNTDEPNYLLFHTDNSPELRLILRQLFLEHFRYDLYTNRCSIQWLNLLFANILRSSRGYFQYSNHGNGPDCAPILRYLQGHYREVTMDELSRRFHYTKPYLSKIIKMSTGYTFSALVRNLKLTEAERLLKSSSASVENIAELVGYRSADHFSRMFRSRYGVPPQTYRAEYRRQKQSSLSLL